MIAKLMMVGIGGGYGALIRLSITNYCKKKYKGVYLPYWTLLINIVGSWIMSIFIRVNLESSFYTFFGVGGLGGFTTFSTFNYEMATMYKDGEYKRLIIYFFATYIMAIGGSILILSYGRQ